MNTETQVFSEVLSKLETLGVEYFVTGSIAKVYYSLPRMTRDMDVVVQLPQKDISRFLSAFGGEYHADREMIETAVAENSQFNIIHNTKLVKVDFIAYKDSEFERSKFERKKRGTMFGQSVWILSVEDLILSKLDWAKESSSDFQLRDVADLIKYNATIDTAYLQGWIKKLGLDSIYEKAKEMVSL